MKSTAHRANARKLANPILEKGKVRCTRAHVEPVMCFAGLDCSVTGGYLDWATRQVQIGRFYPPISAASAVHIVGCVHRLVSFHKEVSGAHVLSSDNDLLKGAMQIEVIHAYADKLVSRQCKEKYVANEVGNMMGITQNHISCIT